jgi:hypothetical protein
MNEAPGSESGCCEEECKPIIIRDADKALHLISSERLLA